MGAPYENPGPTRDEIDRLAGAVVLEFGTPWCGFCRATEPVADSALGMRSDVRRIRVEDGSGRKLGRSFGVKLWPTFVFLRDGRELARSVRPRSEAELRDGVDAITRA